MKNFIKKIKEIKKTENGKAILFFGFYLVFFLILFSIIIFGGKKDYLIQEYEKGKPASLNTSWLLNKNYYYDYKIKLNGVLSDYYGKRYQDIESFKYNNKEYYRNGKDFFVNNGTWVKCDNPYVFYNLIDVDKVSNLLVNATFVSREEVKEDKYKYIYLLSSNTVNKIVYNTDTDYDEVPNKIIVVIDNKSSVDITYYYDSFCKMSEKCNSLEIETYYEMFNGVKEIDNCMTLDEAVSLADENLYKAKESGRNKVVK